MAKIPVQIIADATASTWLSLSAADGLDGLSLSLEGDVPIDVQLTRFVHDKQRLRQSFGLSHIHNTSDERSESAAAAASAASPPPSTLGVIAFNRSPSSSEMLRKMGLKNPVPKPRNLGLSSMLLMSDTLLPGVDKTASTSSNTEELLAYLNASGMEPSPWQLVHSGCTPAEFAAVSGYSSAAGGSIPNLSFGSASAAAAQAAEEKKSNNNNNNAATGEDGDDVPPPPGDDEDGEAAAAAPTSAPPSARIPPPTPGRITFIIVGDLLAYCNTVIYSMVASMARPFRGVAPRVVEQSLLAYAAQDSVLVTNAIRVSKDGCTVWRPRETASRRHHSSIIHKTSNLAMEASLAVPSWENGCAVFINHPMGPSSSNSSSGSGSMELIPAYRRVLRITWSDAFHGAEHGGPEGRRRFSAPCVAVGVVHSSQALAALRQSEQTSHVFGKMKQSVMWCMSPDAALFPGPHLSPIRGPSFQVQPHLYVPNPLLAVTAGKTQTQQQQQQQQQQSRGTSPRGVSQQHQQQQQTRTSSPSRSISDVFTTAVISNRQAESATPKTNPTVVSTTVTLVCDPAMGTLTFLNNGRRVATWELAELWALNKKGQESGRGVNGSFGGGGSGDGDDVAMQAALKSVFYPVVDIGSAGTIVEVVA